MIPTKRQKKNVLTAFVKLKTFLMVLTMNAYKVESLFKKGNLFLSHADSQKEPRCVQFAYGIFDVTLHLSFHLGFVKRMIRLDISMEALNDRIKLLR